MRIRRALLLALCCIAVSAGAQQHPNQAKGFDPAQIYHFDSIDSVNQFNGNLVVTIPIGQRYPVSAALSYGLTLVYNGNPWDYSWLGETRTLVATPSTRSNAGMGWLISFGRLIDPSDPSNETHPPDSTQQHAFVYESPDGADHTFGNTGRPGQPVFALDDSNIRLTMIAANEQRVELPDGTVQTFKDRPDNIQSSSPDWRLTKMADRFGNSVDVAYSNDGNTWTVSDAAGRNQVLTFRTVEPPEVDLEQTILESVTLAAFNNTAATYSFSYANVAITRPSGDNSALNGFPGAPYRQKMLIGVRLPNGESYSMMKNGAPAYDTAGTPAMLRALTLPTQGRLEWDWGPIEFPEGSALFHVNDADYVDVDHPEVPPPPPPVRKTGVGVIKRRKYDEKNQEIGTWQYARRFAKGFLLNGAAFPGEPCTSNVWDSVAGKWVSRHNYTAAIMESILVEPADHPTTPADPHDPTDTKCLSGCTMTVTYYSVYPHGELDCAVDSQNPHHFTKDEYGLPINRYIDSGNRYLSIQNGFVVGNPMDDPANPDPANHWLQNVPKAGMIDRGSIIPNLLRSRYAAFDAAATLDKHYETSSRTFDSDNNSASGEYTESFNRMYDEGRPKLVVTGGTVGGQARYKATYTAYKPLNRTDPNFAWILAPYTEKCTAEYTAFPGSGAEPRQPANCQDMLEPPSSTMTSSTMESACFSSVTGYLNGRRIYKAAPHEDARDVVTLFSQSLGNTVDEAWFGGDTGVAPGDLCSFQSNGATYRYTYSYMNGSLSEAEAQLGPSSWLFTVKQTIDKNTGFVSAAIDGYDPYLGADKYLSTSYTYNSVGQLTSETPARGATTEYRYTIASGATTPASVEVIKHPNGNASAVLAKSGYVFDALGRVVKQTQLMPGGKTSTIQTRYLPRGLKSSVSQLEEIPQNFTSFEYDALGRLTTSTAPDGAVARSVYHGATSVDRSVGVATAHPYSPSTATTVERYDSFGRIVGVTDPVNTTASYTYDVMDHLRNVAMGTQNRTFTYDQRGFLTSESHPESNPITYSGFDAKGHATVKAVQGGPTLTSTYDGAERLTQVSQGTTVLKQYFYDAVTGSNGSTPVDARGRLLKTFRQNAGGRGVTEFFTYDDRLLLNEKDTVVTESPGVSFKFSQPVSHDELGLPDIITYPTTAQAPAAAPSRTVQNVRVNGRLTEVAGFTKANSPIRYAENGMLNVLTHANGVVDTIGIDPHHMARPSSITFNADICAVPAFTIRAQPATIMSGSSAQIIVTSTDGATNNTYELFEGTTANPNTSTLLGTQASPVFETGALTVAHSYWVRVTNACGKQASSSVVTVSVSTATCVAPVITTEPVSPGTVTAGTMVHLTVGTSASGASYQWYANGAPVSGGTSSALDYIVNATTSFYVAVSTCATTNSDVVTVTVSVTTPSCPQPVVSPSSSSIFAGQSVTLSTNAVGSRYEWHWARQGYWYEDILVSAAEGGQTSSITVRPLKNVRYWVLVKEPCESVQSDDALVNVSTPPGGDLNSDGRTDLVWRNYTTGETWVADGYSANVLKDYSGTQLANTDWHVNGFGDVDGDFYPDIVWHNTVTGANTLWSLATDPANPLSMPVAQPLPSIMTGGVVDPDWRLVGVADVDGGALPRRAELFFRNYRTGADVVIWPSADGQSITKSMAFDSEPVLDWKIVGVAGYEGSSPNAKVIWQNTVTRETRFWYLTLSTNSFIRQISTPPPAGSDPSFRIEGAGNFDALPETSVQVIWRSQTTGALRLSTWDGTSWVDQFPSGAGSHSDARIQLGGDLDACVTPSVTIDHGPLSFCSGSVTLTASTDLARSSYTYHWSNGATTSSITVSTSGTYTVTVTSPEGCAASASVKVSATPAAKPVITASNGATGSADITAGEQVTLTSSAAKTYLWSNGATTSTIIVATAGTYTVTTTDSNGCSATSDPLQVVVHPVPPSNVAATASVVGGAYRVTVTWTNPPNTTYTYTVKRSTDGHTFTQVANPDTTVVANKTYIYCVFSNDGALSSVRAPMDLATTMSFTDDALARVVTRIKAVHLTEVRAAINDVRAVAGLPAATWISITGGVTPIGVAHVNEMRMRLNEALVILGAIDASLGPPALTDPVLESGMPMRADHLQQLRERVK